MKEESYRPSGEEPRPPGPLRLLTIGALVPHKGHAVLIEALSLMSESSELVLLGDGPLRKSLTALADDLGLGERFSLQPFDGAVATALRKNSDLYVQPSRSEGLGTAVIDAMGAGLPVVASAVGGLSELVGTSCGWLVPTGDPAALALQLDQLARALRETPARVTTRAAAARSRAQSRHSPAQMLAGVCSVYDGIL
jgi:glycosyltransferase involved in cell wall biosynthesis